MTSETPRDLLQSIVDSDENHCFVCGRGNPIGLDLRFGEADEKVRAQFISGQWHERWQGMVHGGILASVLDEAMAYVLYFSGVLGITARMDVRYRRPAALGDPLSVEARIVRDAGKVADVAACVFRTHVLFAEAQGRFIKSGSITPENLRQPQL